MGLSYLSNDYDCVCKLVLIGDSGVGKSALLQRFADDDFCESHISTIGVDFKIRTLCLDDKRIKLQMWDTAGQERFRTITSAYYRGAHGIILVYDTTRPESLENIKTWLADVERYAPDGVATLLIGNKTDLEVERKVDTEDGANFARGIGALHLETSAKQAINVEECFEQIAKRCRESMHLVTNAPQKATKLKPITATAQRSSLLDYATNMCSIL